MLITRDNKIEAIKQLRDISRLDLREAKEFVEELDQEHRRTGSW